jgi:hypothetical protein
MLAEHAYIVAIKRALACNCFLLVHDADAGLLQRNYNADSFAIHERTHERPCTLSKSNTFTPLSSLHVTNFASVGEKEISRTARECTEKQQ